MFGMINDALAAGQGAAQEINPILANLLPIGMIMVIFYFMLIRPQAKRQKQQEEMVSGLKKGDKVVTSSGILGNIAKIDEDSLVIETGSGTQITMLKTAVVEMAKK
jgi:preprotein translocase subunit YajC